jgi:hypothetical protein
MAPKDAPILGTVCVVFKELGHYPKSIDRKLRIGRRMLDGAVCQGIGYPCGIDLEQVWICEIAINDAKPAREKTVSCGKVKLTRVARTFVDQKRRTNGDLRWRSEGHGAKKSTNSCFWPSFAVFAAIAAHTWTENCGPSARGIIIHQDAFDDDSVARRRRSGHQLHLKTRVIEEGGPVDPLGKLSRIKRLRIGCSQYATCHVFKRRIGSDCNGGSIAQRGSRLGENRCRKQDSKPMNA